MNFASDNAGPVHPAVMEALISANAGKAAAYGGDDVTQSAVAAIRALFEAPQAAVYFVSTGTAANAIALAALAAPYDAIFCHQAAHIEEDECGAPEFFTNGAKLVPVAGAHGKIDPQELTRAIARTGDKGVHGVQRGPLSLTNLTEAGTAYAPDEIARLAQIARKAGLMVHLDGARLANALAATGATPAEMTWRAGVDVVCFGGTKCGLMGVEAVILFDPARARDFELRRKRGGHLWSKHRYLAAQFLAFVQGDLWRDLAQSANARMAQLMSEIAGLQAIAPLHPVQGNMAFISAPRAAHRRAMAQGAQYYLYPFAATLDGPEDEPLTCRIVTDWSIAAEDVTRLAQAWRG